MARVLETPGRPDRALRRVIRYAVLPEIARRRPDRILVVSPAARSVPGLEAWNVIRVETGGDGPVRCHSQALPFVDDAFDLVILHHVLEDGQEPELQEARRVLKPGGDLFVLGQGSLGWRARLSRRGADRPAIKLLPLCQQLRRRAFVLERCAGCGLAGIPVYWERVWQRPALPFADCVVLHGRHRPLEPIVRRLRFAQPRPAAARREAVESLFRSRA